MARFLVGAARSPNYDCDALQSALGAAISNAGGLPALTGDSILIKTNLLAPAEPERAVVTHPEFLRALTLLLRSDTGASSLHIADNPGYLFTDAKNLFDVSGVSALAGEGVTLGLLSAGGVAAVKRDDFKTLSEVRASVRYLESGYAINAAKLKTHVETEISGCVKNIFGIADTATRKQAHNVRSNEHLAEAIVDIFSVKPPQFNLLDAVTCMEGDGPSYGKPRSCGWVFAGSNAAAVDYVAAVMMGYGDPLTIPLMKAAQDRGFGPSCREEIELVGADWQELPISGFRKSSGRMRLLPMFLRGFAHNLIKLQPRLDEGRCTKCAVCAKVCPVDAISMQSGYPQIKKDACVSCLCCHEMCPTGAMRAHKNALAALISHMRGE